MNEQPIPNRHRTGTEDNTSLNRPVRALVVDDSALMRKLVSKILVDGGIEVLHAARDGEEALSWLRKVGMDGPNVITLDVEMPRMNGVEFLKTVMRERPTPVVMLSSLTEAGADVTMQCLALGAVDCLQKPSGSISVDLEKLEAQIVAKVRAASTARVQCWSPTPIRRPPVDGQRSPALRSMGARDFPIIVIASSTGGPAALGRVIPLLPSSLGAAIVMVQHLPVGFTRSLATRLDAISGIALREAVEGDRLQPGVALVAPAGKHLAFDEAGRVTLNSDPTLWGVRPAADIMMGAAAKQFGARVLGVVLTGMGRDGALGAKAIRREGGYCIAQDETTCAIYGMPRAAFEAGGIDRALPLDEIAPFLVKRVSDMIHTLKA